MYSASKIVCMSRRDTALVASGGWLSGYLAGERGSNLLGG